jgi:hypothetical protein
MFAFMYLEVPVIAILTKLDTVETEVWGELVESGKSVEDADRNAPSIAEKRIKKDYLGRLQDIKPGPARIVQLRGTRLSRCLTDAHSVCHVDMHKTDKGCAVLLQKTAEALNDDALDLMCKSVRLNNLEFNIKNAINQ